MTIEAALGAIGVVLLIGGCALATIGVFGLIVKPDIFDQLHVAGLVTGPGVILVLLAAVGTGSAEIVTSAVLVLAFVLVTSSLSTHAIAHAGLRRYAAAARAVGPPVTGDPAPDGAVTAVGEQDAIGRPRAHGMRVVVADDGSASARVAVDLAAGLDWSSGTVIRVVGVVASRELPSVDAWSTGEADTSGADRPRAPEARLRAAAESIERPGVRVETGILRGEPADRVVEETTAFGADLLIVGSGRGGFEQSVLGWSGAGETLGRVPCPVLVARSQTVRRVLLATDGSTQSQAALELVARWPIFDHARVHVVTVSADAPRDRGEARRFGPVADQRTVDAAAGWLMDAGRDVETEILFGRPAEAVVDAAARRSVDLIVIGSRGRTGLGRELLGSVAGDVLAAAGCSVLIVGPRPRRVYAAS